MYTEENQRGRFPLRDILLKAIVVIIFLILIIFIITRVTTPNNKNNNSTSQYDEVFSENLETMEKAAFNYYTKDKLPLEVGAVSELTLREMINSNLLEAFTDADGNACDVNNSYIRLTKNDDDYTLRVNLKCDKKEDYSLMKVGEYDYCEHDICKRDSGKENNKNDKEDTADEVEITETTDTTTRDNTTNSDNSNSNNASNYGGNNSSITTSPPIVTLYEYRKVTNPVLSGWSSWSPLKLNGNRYTAVKCGVNDANCLREVLLYSRTEVIGDDDNGNPVYGTVTYYSYRTRTLISSGSTDTKWSTYNDTNLLNQGYTYTGNTR